VIGQIDRTRRAFQVGKWLRYVALQLTRSRTGVW